MVKLIISKPEVIGGQFGQRIGEKSVDVEMKFHCTTCQNSEQQPWRHGNSFSMDAICELAKLSNYILLKRKREKENEK